MSQLLFGFGSLEFTVNDYALFECNFSDRNCVITRVCFSTPSVRLFKYQKDAWTEWYREIGIRCPTTFLFHKAGYFWSLTAVLLGFGVSLSHQNGY